MEPSEWNEQEGQPARGQAEGPTPPERSDISVLLQLIRNATPTQRLEFLAALGNSPASADAAAAHAKRKPLPWPTWDGKPETFYFFLSRLQAKYVTDEKWGLNGCKDTVWYSLLHTLPEPQMRRIAGFWDRGGPNHDKDPQAFFNHLIHAFGNVQEQEKAQDKLRTLRQRDGQSFGEFLPDFEETLSRAAGATVWEDSAKLTWLRNSISPALRELLIPIVMPRTFSEYVSRLTKVAWGYEQTPRFQRLRKRTPLSGEGVTPLPQEEQLDRDGDTFMGQTQSTPSRAKKNKPPKAGQQTAKWVSNEEIEERRLGGRCLRCGAGNHFVRQCPFRPAKRPSPTVGIRNTSFPPLLEDELPATPEAEGKE